ncbi:hypothetical protein BASA84_000669, partial [Batrachochytrium salamandrivorans]
MSFTHARKGSKTHLKSFSPSTRFSAVKTVDEKTTFKKHPASPRTHNSAASIARVEEAQPHRPLQNLFSNRLELPIHESTPFNAHTENYSKVAPSTLSDNEGIESACSKTRSSISGIFEHESTTNDASRSTSAMSFSQLSSNSPIISTQRVCPVSAPSSQSCMLPKDSMSTNDQCTPSTKNAYHWYGPEGSTDMNSAAKNHSCDDHDATSIANLRRQKRASLSPDTMDPQTRSPIHSKQKGHYPISDPSLSNQHQKNSNTSTKITLSATSRPIYQASKGKTVAPSSLQSAPYQAWIKPTKPSVVIQSSLAHDPTLSYDPPLDYKNNTNTITSESIESTDSCIEKVTDLQKALRSSSQKNQESAADTSKIRPSHIPNRSTQPLVSVEKPLEKHSLLSPSTREIHHVLIALQEHERAIRSLQYAIADVDTLLSTSSLNAATPTMHNDNISSATGCGTSSALSEAAPALAALSVGTAGALPLSGIDLPLPPHTYSELQLQINAMASKLKALEGGFTGLRVDPKSMSSLTAELISIPTPVSSNTNPTANSNSEGILISHECIPEHKAATAISPAEQSDTFLDKQHDQTLPIDSCTIVPERSTLRVDSLDIPNTEITSPYGHTEKQGYNSEKALAEQIRINETLERRLAQLETLLSKECRPDPSNCYTNALQKPDHTYPHSPSNQTNTPTKNKPASYSVIPMAISSATTPTAASRFESNLEWKPKRPSQATHTESEPSRELLTNAMHPSPAEGVDKTRTLSQSNHNAAIAPIIERLDYLETLFESNFARHNSFSNKTVSNCSGPHVSSNHKHSQQSGQSYSTETGKNRSNCKSGEDVISIGNNNPISETPIPSMVLNDSIKEKSVDCDIFQEIKKLRDDHLGLQNLVLNLTESVRKVSGKTSVPAADSVHNPIEAPASEFSTYPNPTKQYPGKDGRDKVNTTSDAPKLDCNMDMIEVAKQLRRIKQKMAGKVDTIVLEELIRHIVTHKDLKKMAEKRPRASWIERLVDQKIDEIYNYIHNYTWGSLGNPPGATGSSKRCTTSAECIFSVNPEEKCWHTVKKMIEDHQKSISSDIDIKMGTIKQELIASLAKPSDCVSNIARLENSISESEGKIRYDLKVWFKKQLVTTMSKYSQKEERRLTHTKEELTNIAKEHIGSIWKDNLKAIQHNHQEFEEIQSTSKRLSREFDEKLFLLCSDLSECKSLFSQQALQPFYRCAQWLWKSGSLKMGSAIPWNYQTVNTEPGNFKWNQD